MKFKMEIKTNEMRDRVLTKMENDGIIWASGDKATKFECYDAPMYLFCKGESITQSSSKSWFEERTDFEELNPVVYLGANKITITEEDGFVVARDSYGRVGYCKREGCYLYNCSSATINIDQFEVGDRVIVRDWNGMEAQYGTNSYGSVNCRNSFTEPMKKFCGRTGTIVGKGRYNSYSVEIDFDDKADENSWSWSTDMITHTLIQAPPKERRFRCIHENGDDTSFVVGKIYVLKSDGTVRSETGFNFDPCESANAIEWLEDYTKFRFEEVDENATDIIYMNGKVVCVNDDGGAFTKGRIYEVRNGHIVVEDGKDGIKNCERAKNIDDINRQFISEFIKLVE